MARQRAQEGSGDAQTLPPQSEAQWQATVLSYARLRGFRAYHTHDSRRSQAGFPDLVLIRRPTIIFAELKRQNGRLRPEQTAWIDELRACGMRVFVWRPSDFDEVQEIMG